MESGSQSRGSMLREAQGSVWLAGGKRKGGRLKKSVGRVGGLLAFMKRRTATKIKKTFLPSKLTSASLKIWSAFELYF